MMKYFVPLMILAGCGLPSNDPSTGGQTGEETIGCLPQSRVELTRGEASSLGFSAADFLDTFAGASVDIVNWEDAEPSDITIDVTEAGFFEFIDYEWIDDSDAEIGTAIGTDCPDRVEATVSVELSTADGLLDETFDTRLRAIDADNADLYWNAKATEFNGAFDFSAHGDPEKTDAWIEVFYTTRGTQGTFAATIEDDQGPDDPDGAVSATLKTFATW